MHDFKFHEGHIRSLDFHPLEFLLATGGYRAPIQGDSPLSILANLPLTDVHLLLDQCTVYIFPSSLFNSFFFGLLFSLNVEICGLQLHTIPFQHDCATHGLL